MKELNQLLQYIYFLGSLLMVVGAILYAMFLIPKISCWVMLIGAIMFSAMQYKQKYLGKELVLCRLRRIMLFSSVCLIAAGAFMLEDSYEFLKPFASNWLGSYSLYIKVFYHNWVVLLLIGAVLELYSTQRINSELKKSK